MMIRTAVLIEVASIQQYIFSSNKLKENIGASYIIEHLLFDTGKLMNQVIVDLEIDRDFNPNDWKNNLSNDQKTCFTGYIGGGNTLLFFKEKSDAKRFMQEFSTRTLLAFPSLRLVFGIKEDFIITDEHYQSEFQILLSHLQKNKSTFVPITSVYKHGITADCPWSNELAEFYHHGYKEYLSAATISKLAASEEAKASFRSLYNIPSEYTITDEVDKLGQDSEGSYIAVVHIDGNGMGRIFSKISTLDELRQKSKAVSNKVIVAMQHLIQHLSDPAQNSVLAHLKLKKDNDQVILPIRPILVGGDDVTFVCEGTLGFYLAEKFISLLYDDEERKKPFDSPERLMDGACAGVAIIKTTFPFYKAVKLAEELCGEAKKRARIGVGEAKSCYISYYISSTTFSGAIEELRERTHETPHGSCYYGPYLLFHQDESTSVYQLLQGMRHFSTWPHTKLMSLREVIAADKSWHKLFEKEMEEIPLQFPGSKTTIWENNTTPWFDQIELIEFYPEALLNQPL